MSRSRSVDYCKEQIIADCEALLSSFQQTESVRYEIFSKIWREMNFSNIFYGRFDGKEKRGFTSQVLLTAFRYLFPPYTFQIRVGALYLLYGLYHSQLVEPKEKIRLALKNWEDIKKFEQDAINAQHFDAVYIFRKLVAEKAIFYTATTMPLTFDTKKYVKRQTLCDEFMDRAQRPQELVDMEMLEELSRVHEHYERMKSDLSAMPGQSDLASTSVIRMDLVPQLRETVNDYHEWQKKQKKSWNDDEEVGEGTSDQKECSRRAELLASIKSKSYGHVAEAAKSRRHRQCELDVTSHITGPPEKLRIQNRESLKSRTSKLLNIDETETDSVRGTPWCLSETEAKRISERPSRQELRFKW